MLTDDQIFRCPVELTLEVIGGKWATIVLAHLKEGVHRYGALRRKMPDVSEKVLVQRLRALEATGLIARRSDQGTPPRVEYRLTQEGLSLVPVLEALYTWGEQRAARTGARIEPM
ncbi:helix-turn-helix domain-containing protein [Streptacidiphilus sp. P02-A3a]|uniref:winged helix-turn-helix transcriptional regulator n=1 Tax=Streptacidiphilus sp. P02-A3a TaxID=2704468 RepID=UPI0015F7D45F|nr:helix-turn-helix domain-containing protein [Streptacidiphilus sp. P02-A3a]QMU70081.1 helix-turn-helix transcriptional regulator [Streptacidiphilus sp. P02-A3a]QMU70466.1 helix-turn-helix transcriptional regulator [Streptacidiphilus sp. P02-A3a]